VRNAFIKQLCIEAEADDRVWLICGDLGYSVLEIFAKRFPQQFINAGVAEQNMMGIAAGLAHSGCIPFVYSIANFPVMRCLEQIRNDVCYHNLPVRIVAVGGGLTYAAHGYTHHGTEDLAVMRVMPNMTVLAPADPVETNAAMSALWAVPGPVYLRLGKAGEPVVHGSNLDFRLGRAIPVRDGDDAAIITIGGVLTVAIEAAERLGVEGKSVRVLSMPTLEPFDEAAVIEAAKTGTLITLEEHGIGGLASAVAETLAIRGVTTNFHPLRLPREPFKVADGQAALRTRGGLSAEAIVSIVREGRRHR
jgi:transketolase